MTETSVPPVPSTASPIDNEPSLASGLAAQLAGSRRQFLRGAVIAGGGLAAATLAACTPTSKLPAWTYGPNPTTGAPSATGAVATAAPSAAASHDHGAESPAPSAAADDHDAAALAVVKRFLGGEAAAVEGMGNQLFGDPKIDNGAKLFELTIDKISHKIDAQKAPIDALGFNGTWPGPRIDVIEGDRVKAVFTNNLDETTGIHFHGQQLPNNMDGVPHITQDPIQPGASFTYEFTAKTTGSHMYHSHHNATDQVGRGLLGAFIVHPRDEKERAANKYGVTQDIVW
ncbi:MAG TPA: multicopper oxidase domain-containing protein, partial [Candidatus Limnocylindrales bacterium]|nr:multicopper oxidase domain-containing protein [Candidatus Limnocylindrales bacterium]